jgi:hypothetical protein
MKRNDWILLAATASYSFLFYKELPGINVLIFSIILIGLLALRNNEVIRNKQWWAAAIGTIVTACCVTMYGNVLSVLGNVVSLSILSFTAVSPQSSVLIGMFSSLYSTVSSWLYMLKDVTNRYTNSSKEDKVTAWKSILLVIVPLVIALLFFGLYRIANPTYDLLTENINFSFISPEWVFFTFVGLLLLYGFFYHQKIPVLFEKDLKAENKIDQYAEPGRVEKLVGLITENTSGIVLLAMLNFILLSVNVVDINYLYLKAELPEGISYSEYVHEGIGALIMSIVLAIGIILFYFRGRLNFYEKNGPIKWLALLWVAQNALLVTSTAFRNQQYIEAFSLTYKRIGVYVYLLLTLIGLIITIVKIVRIRSNWFMVRTTGWSFYAVLVLSCTFSWNIVIAEFNIDRALRENKPLDRGYLLSLGDNMLPYLVKYQRQVERNAVDEEVFDLQWEIDEFIHEWKATSWKSWSYEKSKVYHELMQLISRRRVGDISELRIKPMELDNNR